MMMPACFLGESCERNEGLTVTTLESPSERVKVILVKVVSALLMRGKDPSRAWSGESVWVMSRRGLRKASAFSGRGCSAFCGASGTFACSSLATR